MVSSRITADQWLELSARKEASGVIADDQEKVIQVMTSDMNPRDAFLMLSGLRNANISLARLIHQRAIGDRSICQVFEGEVISSYVISADTAPEPPEQAVPLQPSVRYEIPVLTLGILEGSAWTTDEVRARGHGVRRALRKCGVNIKKLRVVRLSNPEGTFNFIHSAPKWRDFGEPPNAMEQQLEQLTATKGIRGSKYVRALTE